MFKSAFFESDITPPIGSIIPGDFAARYGDGILDKLYARAFVATDSGGQSTALIVIDACGLYKSVTDRIKEKISKYTPIRPESIVVMATHTHSGGPTLNWGEEVMVCEAYIDFLVDRAADAAIYAYQGQRESVFQIGSNELHGVSFIRIYKMEDGTLKTNPKMNDPNILEPVTKIDPEVVVLSVLQEGKPVGAVVNFACHPAIVAGTKYSADFIGVLCAELKKQYGSGFITLFVNGACGNINHINAFDPTTVEPNRHVVVGKALAGKAIEIIANSEKLDGKIKSAEKTIRVGIRKPSADYLIWAKEYFDSLGDSLIDSTPNTPGYRNTFFALQAFNIQADKRTGMDVYLQAVKFGELILYAVPCQMFTEFGLKIKAKCPEKYAMVSIFANDYLGYVPTPECMAEGVYEASLAATSMLEAAAGDKVCDAVTELI